MFVPLLVWLIDAIGWRATTMVGVGCVASVLIPVLLLMRDDPGDRNPAAGRAAPPRPAGPSHELSGSLGRALGTPEFWLLAGSCFVCGAMPNGLIGTHFMSHAVETGFPQSVPAGLMGLIGAMNFVRTLASGWLTDRYDPRTLLAVY